MVSTLTTVVAPPCRTCTATSIEGSGSEGEFPCVCCSAPVKATALYSPAALHAALGEAAGPGGNKEEAWTSSAKVSLGTGCTAELALVVGLYVA